MWITIQSLQMVMFCWFFYWLSLKGELKNCKGSTHQWQTDIVPMCHGTEVLLVSAHVAPGAERLIEMVKWSQSDSGTHASTCDPCTVHRSIYNLLSFAVLSTLQVCLKKLNFVSITCCMMFHVRPTCPYTFMMLIFCCHLMPKIFL